MSAKVKKLVWLWMRRNGMCKDLRLMFSRYAAQKHFAFETRKLRFHRASAQYQCKLHWAVQPRQLMTEIEVRVQKYASCECAKCKHDSVAHLKKDTTTRTWLRYTYP
jgi:hypothetical protein